MKVFGLGWCVGVTLLSACRVSWPQDASFACNTDRDCAGGGYVCLTQGRVRGMCCLPATEACDGRDNDCDGSIDEDLTESCFSATSGSPQVGQCRAGTRQCAQGEWLECVGQVVPVAEVCDSLDNDCDGRVDEDFDFQTSVFHCGGCGKACETGFKCDQGSCSLATEKICNNLSDDDGDGKIDCADEDCENEVCGSTCRCKNLRRGEGACDDFLDNDSDGSIDCADSDCASQSCGNGCTCALSLRTESNCGDFVDNDGDGTTDCLDADCFSQTCGSGCACVASQKVETDCQDAKDNDGDGALDCVDADCLSKACKPSPNTFVCTNQKVCACTGAVNPPAESGSDCTDGLDNNCNGKIDCEEVECNAQPCGIDCVCKLGVRTEMRCNDFLDNDLDGKTDCSDKVDCSPNSPCKFVFNNSELDGTCQTDSTCQ